MKIFRLKLHSLLFALMWSNSPVKVIKFWLLAFYYLFRKTTESFGWIKWIDSLHATFTVRTGLAFEQVHPFRTCGYCNILYGPGLKNVYTNSLSSENISWIALARYYTRFYFIYSSILDVAILFDNIFMYM